MTKKKEPTTAEKKLLSMPIGSFFKMDMYVGDDPEPYKIEIHQASLAVFMEKATRRFGSVRFDLFTASIAEGSFLRANGRGKNASAMSELLADAVVISWEKVQN